MIQEVYFSNPADRPLGGGQLRYECVAAGEGARRTKPIADCRLETVVSRCCTAMIAPCRGIHPVRCGILTYTSQA